MQRGENQESFGEGQGSFSGWRADEGTKIDAVLDGNEVGGLGGERGRRL